MAQEPRKSKGGAKEQEEQFTHIFINSPIDGSLYREVLSKLTRDHRGRTAVLTLITHGGFANDAYRIGRYLQLGFPKLYVHVPTVCASAGTLLMCAGEKLILSPLSELGPLDPQILKSDELHARRSGLVVRSIFENLGNHVFDLYAGLVENIIDHSNGMIKYRTAAQIAGEMSVGLLEGLYGQINPEQIGEDYRLLKVAEEYGKRLASKSRNISDEGVQKLVYEFPAHDFIIDFREAVELFETVAVPSDALIGDYRGADTPLGAVPSKDRVVRITVVKGKPDIGSNDQDNGAEEIDEIHVEGTKNGEDSTEASGASGRSPSEGDAKPAPVSGPDGANAGRNRGRRKGGASNSEASAEG